MRASPGQGRVDGGDFPLRPTPDNREIFLCYPLLLHQKAEAPRRGRCLRYQNQATGLAIEPVDNGDLAAIRDFECKQGG